MCDIRKKCQTKNAVDNTSINGVIWGSWNNLTFYQNVSSPSSHCLKFSPLDSQMDKCVT